MVLPPTIRQLLRSPIPSNLPKTTTTVSGWIKSIRKQKNISFAVITDGSSTKGLQAVLVKEDEDLLRRLTNGAAVRLTGRLVSSPGKEQSCELLVDQKDVGEVVVLGECDPETYPIQKKTLTSEYLRDHAHLRSRTHEISAMVKLRSLLTREIGSWFEKSDFTYVHTPIITGNDAEGAGEAFRLAPVEIQHPSSASSSSISQIPSLLPPTPSEFFSRPAFLTVSHQLHLEALATAISRVYTLSPCFRAEPSLTSRHLAEFWMLEAEWAFPGSNGVLDVCDFTESFLRDSLNNIIQQQSEIVVESLWKICDAKKRLSIEDALNKKGAWTRMTYTEAIQELEKFSSSSSSSSPLPPKFEHTPKWGRTLQSEHERWLAESLIGEPVFITNYPKSLKPFYMRSNDDDKTVACFDLLVPHVGELIGGSVREERPRVLEEKMREAGLLSSSSTTDAGPDADGYRQGSQLNSEYQWYLDLRKFGGAPHAGFGMGFERLVGWVGCVDNIRECIPMPRWAGRMLL